MPSGHERIPPADSHPTRPPSRAELTRALVLNAATKPVNVGVAAAVAVAAFLLQAVWLLPVAALIYAVLVTMTFFDSGEADAVARRRRDGRERAKSVETVQLEPRIRRFLDAALHEEQLIRETIGDSDLGYADLSSEVDDLVAALRSIARRAQRLFDYLSSQDSSALEGRLRDLGAQQRRSPTDDRAQLIAALSEQIDTVAKAERQLERFESEMEHTTAVLATLHGQLVQMSVTADSLGEQRLTEQVRTLREQVGTAAQAMDEVARDAA